MNAGETRSRPKKALSDAQMKAVRIAAYNSHSLVMKRAAAALVMGYAGYMRISEVHGLTGADVEVVPGRIRVAVSKAKRNAHGYAWEERAVTSNGRFILHYLKCIALGRSKDQHFLPVIQAATDTLPQRSAVHRRISISTLRKDLKELLQLAGIDSSEYSFHAAKRGAATRDLLAGMSEEEVAKRGRWKHRKNVKFYDKRHDM